MFGLAADTMPYVGWGLSPVRLRQRRLARLLRRQRPRRRQPESGRPGPPSTPSPRCSTATSPIKNGQGRRFQLATRDVGPYFDAKHVARGRRVRRLRRRRRRRHRRQPQGRPRRPAPQRHPDRNRWLRLQLVGTRSNRDAVGARVERRSRGPDHRPPAQGGVQRLLGQRPPPDRSASARPPRSGSSRSAGPPGAVTTRRTSRPTRPSGSSRGNEAPWDEP